MYCPLRQTSLAPCCASLNCSKHGSTLIHGCAVRFLGEENLPAFTCTRHVGPVSQVASLVYYHVTSPTHAAAAAAIFDSLVPRALSAVPAPRARRPIQCAARTRSKGPAKLTVNGTSRDTLPSCRACRNCREQSKPIARPRQTPRDRFPASLGGQHVRREAQCAHPPSVGWVAPEAADETEASRAAGAYFTVMSWPEPIRVWIRVPACGCT